MVLRVADDYGTLNVSLNGELHVNICDASSYRCLGLIQRYLLNRSELLPLTYFELDCSTGVCSVFSCDVDDEFNPLIPVLKFRIKNRLFNSDCYLLRLYNIFATKKSRIVLS